ncbi:MAG: sugar-binding domain-containing protein [Bacteroidota bacterium]
MNPFLIIHAIAFALLIHVPLIGQMDQNTNEASAVREELSLNGEWNIIFDEGNKGREGGWNQEQAFFASKRLRNISVPSSWEEIEQDYEGVAFYGRHFSVPKNWEGKYVQLQFDAVNYIAEVWVNDHPVGMHEGGYGPFELRVEDFLKYGEKNFMSLRVVGPILNEDKHIDGLGPYDMPHWRGAITGGIWQPVKLLATNKLFVDDIFVKPNISDNTAEIDITLENKTKAIKDISYQVEVFARNNPSDIVASKTLSAELNPGHTVSSLTLEIPDATYWEPKNPHLYIARVTLSEASQKQDVDEVRFGMRELTIKGDEFMLNGKPIYIKGVFFEGLYPVKMAYPDSEEMARKEIQLAMDCGFNVIRPWRKPPPPMWLDLCDEMGLMVYGGLALECMDQHPTATPYLNKRIENEVRSTVLRDRNHPCVIEWEIFNEVHRQEVARLKHDMALVIRNLDPTRLILDESGGFFGGSNMYLPGSYEGIKFNDVHAYPGAPLDNGLYDKFQTISRTDEELKKMGLPRGRFTHSETVQGALSIVSEIGYGSLPDLVDNNERFRKMGNPLTPAYRYHQNLASWFTDVLAETGFDAIYPDLQEFCKQQQRIHSQGNKRMLEAIRSNEKVKGYVVHAFTGGDWVTGAGLLDLFRNPKESYYGTQEANQPRYLALQVRPRNIYAHQGAKIILKGINDEEAISGKLMLTIQSEKGKLIKTIEKNVDLKAGINEILNEPLNTQKLSGIYTATVSLSDESGNEISTNEFGFEVYIDKQLEPSSANIALFDANKFLTGFLKDKGMAYEMFDANTAKDLPVFVTQSTINGPEDEERFRQLAQFAKEGGTVVHLGVVRPRDQNLINRGGKVPDAHVLPFEITLRPARGLWITVSHLVAKHPVFNGLPANCMMENEYENIWSSQSIQGVEEKDLIVASVSHDWYFKNPVTRNYRGPEPAWYGVDLGTVAYGEGQYVLSALRIVKNLGKDPVADKLMLNMINWTSKLSSM